MTGAGTAAAQDAPSNTTQPAISGTATVGSTLTATQGSWTGNPTSFAFQWVRCPSDGGDPEAPTAPRSAARQRRRTSCRALMSGSDSACGSPRRTRTGRHRCLERDGADRGRGAGAGADQRPHCVWYGARGLDAHRHAGPVAQQPDLLLLPVGALPDLGRKPDRLGLRSDRGRDRCDLSGLDRGRRSATPRASHRDERGRLGNGGLERDRSRPGGHPGAGADRVPGREPTQSGRIRSDRPPGC